MSDVLHGIGDELGGDEDPSRRRSLWVLVSLFAAAALVAILMVALGAGGSSNRAAPPADISAPVVFQSSTPSTPTSAIESSAEPTHSSVPTFFPAGVGNLPGGNPCPSAAGCVLNEDGGVLAAVNALRSGKNLPQVPGGVSTGGQQCALALGKSASCQPHYIYTYQPTLDGEKAVQGTQSFNPTWLLDPNMTKIEFGWAYQNGKYILAILKWP